MCVSPLFKHKGFAYVVHMHELSVASLPSAQFGLSSLSPEKVGCEKLSPSKLELGTTFLD